MQSTFGREFTRAWWRELLCVAMGSGSDSARVNEVAKLCRAVVRMTKGKKGSEGSSAGLGREFGIGLLKDC